MQLCQIYLNTVPPHRLGQAKQWANGAQFFVLQGVASSSSDTMVQNLPPRTMSAPPASVICEPSALEPPPGFSGSHEATVRKISLARVPSDPMKRFQTTTGILLVMRNDALARIKVACDSYGTVKTNVAKRWEALCKAGHVAESSVPPDMSAWVRQFNDTLSKLKNEMKKGCFHVDAVISTSTFEKQKGHIHDLRTGPGCHVYGSASECY
jgi:hypothetical protein